MTTEELQKLPLEEQAKATPKHMTKAGITCIVFGLFAMLIITAVSKDSQSHIYSSFEGWMLIIITASFFIGGICLFCASDSQQEEIIDKAQRIISEQRHKQIEDDNKRKEAREKIKQYDKEYGDVTKLIKVNEGTKIEDYILVYKEAKKLILNGIPIPFEDVLSITIEDEANTLKGQIKPQRNNSEIIGRAVVGGLIAGETGAIIGGMSAAQNTSFTQESDTIIHDFSAIVHLNSLDNPILSIHIGKDRNAANEIKALFNVILNSK